MKLPNVLRTGSLKTVEWPDGQAYGQYLSIAITHCRESMAHCTIEIAAFAWLKRQRRVMLCIETQSSLQYKNELLAIMRAPLVQRRRFAVVYGHLKRDHNFMR